jgi:Leucine-rich repeat (LRR) protein
MLSGQLPEELGNLTSLRELYCFDNRFSGYLSPALFGMVNLQYLGLNGNQFTGPIPNEIGSVFASVSLSLSRPLDLSLS